MAKKLFVLCFTVFVISGCAGLPKVWNTGFEGYNSREGISAKQAITQTALPLVGEPWATIIGSIAGLLAGGYAVHKRRKYLDTPPA